MEDRDNWKYHMADLLAISLGMISDEQWIEDCITRLSWLLNHNTDMNMWEYSSLLPILLNDHYINVMMHLCKLWKEKNDTDYLTSKNFLPSVTVFMCKSGTPRYLAGDKFWLQIISRFWEILLISYCVHYMR